MRTLRALSWICLLAQLISIFWGIATMFFHIWPGKAWPMLIALLAIQIIKEVAVARFLRRFALSANNEVTRMFARNSWVKELELTAEEDKPKVMAEHAREALAANGVAPLPIMTLLVIRGIIMAALCQSNVACVGALKKKDREELKTKINDLLRERGIDLSKYDMTVESFFK